MRWRDKQIIQDLIGHSKGFGSFQEDSMKEREDEKISLSPLQTVGETTGARTTIV